MRCRDLLSLVNRTIEELFRKSVDFEVEKSNTKFESLGFEKDLVHELKRFSSKLLRNWPRLEVGNDENVGVIDLHRNKFGE
ncbi:hypothetical protein TNCT_430851 [Trichonephila clavata]|uniref:Uncharacterized protein n=1 Tax=Trichonephila clavata TaxID=2740835 RepID=A0A8X6FQH1_TRICU|nr:hypothetical protein TNCT_430851 [Trichonephila clavata]